MHRTVKKGMAVALALVSTAASADFVQVFHANGVTESVSQQATARFDFASPTSLSITLTNNVDPTEFIQSILDGIEFSLSSPATLTLTGVTAVGAINCSPGGGITPGSPCPAAGAPDPFYGWGSLGSGSSVSLGSGFNGSTFAFHPYDIVNASYNIAGGGTGLSDPAYNPLLVGPVTFSFAIAGATGMPQVTSANFVFGDPIRIAAVTVPEPASLTLVALGLLAVAFGIRRRNRKDAP